MDIRSFGLHATVLTVILSLRSKDEAQTQCCLLEGKRSKLSSQISSHTNMYTPTLRICAEFLRKKIRITF